MSQLTSVSTLSFFCDSFIVRCEEEGAKTREGRKNTSDAFGAGIGGLRSQPPRIYVHGLFNCFNCHPSKLSIYFKYKYYITCEI